MGEGQTVTSLKWFLQPRDAQKTLKGSWRKSTAPPKIKQGLSDNCPPPFTSDHRSGRSAGATGCKLRPGYTFCQSPRPAEGTRAGPGPTRPSPAPTVPNGSQRPRGNWRAASPPPSPLPLPPPPQAVLSFLLLVFRRAPPAPGCGTAAPARSGAAARGSGGSLPERRGGCQHRDALPRRGAEREGAPPPWPPQPAPPLSGLSSGRGRLRAASPRDLPPLLRPRPPPPAPPRPRRRRHSRRAPAAAVAAAGPSLPPRPAPRPARRPQRPLHCGGAPRPLRYLCGALPFPTPAGRAVPSGRALA